MQTHLNQRAIQCTHTHTGSVPNLKKTKQKFGERKGRLRGHTH